MNDNEDAQKYRELVNAWRERDKAKQTLAACERRISELLGLLPEDASFKPRKKAQSRNEFVAGCLGGRA